MYFLHYFLFVGFKFINICKALAKFDDLLRENDTNNGNLLGILYVHLYEDHSRNEIK
jgi:hypothetical protein